MEAKRAVRWAAYYRGIATLSFVVGIGIAAYGFSAGLGEAIDILINNYPAQQAEAEAAANVPLALGAIVVGVLVWQVGKSAAFYWTLTSAVDEATGVDAAAGAVDAPPREPGAPEPATAPAAGGPQTGNADPVGQGTDAVAPTDGPGSAVADSPPMDDPGTPGAGRDSPADPNVSEDPENGESDADAGARTGSPSPGDEGTARTGTAPAEEAGDRQRSADADPSGEAAVAASGSDADADDAPDGVACPDCGYPNKEDVSFCMNCGAEL